jgi:uncharacterized protein YggE
MKLFRLVGLAAAVALLVAFAGVGRPERASSSTTDTSLRTITVNGSGIISSVPDRAQFSFGVTATAKTASAALATNTADMTKVIATLKAHGIQDADIQTAGVSLSPSYNQAGDTVTGYTATNTVTALIRHLDQAGSTIDAAVNAGANQVNGPTLSQADQQTLYQQALKAAIADAHTRAATIAAAANATLGAVRTVTETTNTPIPFATSGAAKTPAPTTPIQPGTIQTEADITITYDIS